MSKAITHKSNSVLAIGGGGGGAVQSQVQQSASTKPTHSDCVDATKPTAPEAPLHSVLVINDADKADGDKGGGSAVVLPGEAKFAAFKRWCNAHLVGGVEECVVYRHQTDPALRFVVINRWKLYGIRVVRCGDAKTGADGKPPKRPFVFTVEKHNTLYSPFADLRAAQMVAQKFIVELKLQPIPLSLCAEVMTYGNSARQEIKQKAVDHMERPPKSRLYAVPPVFANALMDGDGDCRGVVSPSNLVHCETFVDRDGAELVLVITNDTLCVRMYELTLDAATGRVRCAKVQWELTKHLMWPNLDAYVFSRALKPRYLNAATHSNCRIIGTVPVTREQLRRGDHVQVRGGVPVLGRFYEHHFIVLEDGGTRIIEYLKREVDAPPEKSGRGSAVWEAGVAVAASISSTSAIATGAAVLYAAANDDITAKSDAKTKPSTVCKSKSDCSGCPEAAKIQVTSIDASAFDDAYSTRDMKRVVWSSKSDAETILERALSRRDERQYGLVANNCEHFSAYCMTGRADSAQVITAYGAAGRLALKGVSGATAVLDALVNDAAERVEDAIAHGGPKAPLLNALNWVTVGVTAGALWYYTCYKPLSQQCATGKLDAAQGTKAKAVQALDALGGGAAAIAGQVLLPIPVVGGLVGHVVGSFVLGGAACLVCLIVGKIRE